MATLTIELPDQRKQTEFNLRRWAEVLSDPELAQTEGRIETDRHGNILMSPPPGADHGGYQGEIIYLLRVHMAHGRTLGETPISTADGVRAPDAAWASEDCVRRLAKRVCYVRAPDICVEILSPENTKSEILQKMNLYFDAGAREVWICDKSGAMSFFEAGGGGAMPESKICPKFPKRINLQ